MGKNTQPSGFSGNQFNASKSIQRFII